MTRKHQILKLLAALYAIVMLYLLLVRKVPASDIPYWEQVRHHYNLVPFHTINLFIFSLIKPWFKWQIFSAILNLFGNILLFIPLGMFPPLLWEKANRFWKVFLLSAGIMSVIEIMQMLLLVGTCDIDDLILNLLGASIGYGIYKLIPRKK